MYRHGGKRVLDLVVTVAAILTLAAVFGAIAALVRLTLGAPVLFQQERAGRLGEVFTIWKFRTMTEARGPDGHTLPDVDRLTWFGRLLRRSSLDEIPELWNVLTGDMSLVGPRPLLTRYLDRYTPEQSRRHEVQPGITGLAQVSGRNTLTWEDRFALDVWYVDHVSLLLDLRIMALTVWKIARREGISQAGQATMEEFRGSGPPKQPEQSNGANMATGPRQRENHG